MIRVSLPLPVSLAASLFPHTLWVLSCLATAATEPTPAEPVKPAAPLAAPAPSAALRLAKLKDKYGDRMLYEVDDKLRILFVMGTDQRSLGEVKQRLTAHAVALQHDLFKHGIKDYLAVIVPRKWANPKVTGHFYPDLVDAATIGSNLMHEFTHALHYADQVGRGEYQPVWIMEGLASLYEESAVVDGHAVPTVNHRLLKLQEEVKNKHYLPFAKMMKLERRQFTSHQYAQARYMCMYFHATGQLPQWYATYTAGFAADASGIAATEHVYGKPLGEVEQDWVAWLLKQVPPRLVVGPGAAGLGIGTQQLPDAVEITQLAPQQAADLAGLVVGDAVIRVDGERMIEMESLGLALARHRVGDAVKLEYRRHGEYRETTATLTALPAASPPAKQPL